MAYTFTRKQFSTADGIFSYLPDRDGFVSEKATQWLWTNYILLIKPNYRKILIVNPEL